jgi:dienelactone hydrolase
MTGGTRLVQVASVALMILAGTTLAGGCGRNAPLQPPFPVTSTVVSQETTKPISVWAPETEGARPVVYLLHGINGSPQDMEVLGRAVAEQGYLVFALDWDDHADPDQDIACGYHYSQSIAADHGGDPHRTVAVGYSQGASYVLPGATSQDVDGRIDTFDPCSVEQGRSRRARRAETPRRARDDRSVPLRVPGEVARPSGLRR